MRNRINQDDLKNGRALLAKAFADLRKQGFMARQNCMCCSGCACSKIWTDIQKKPGKYIGAVYYHSQDAARLKESGEVCIGFGPVDTDAEEWAWLLAGHAAQSTFKRYGLAVEWDGTVKQKLTVKLVRT
jgi:hypothetical protein